MSALPSGPMTRGLPVFDNPQAWRGPQVAGLSDWIHAFTEDEVAEIEAAVRRADRPGRDIVGMNRDDFPLPGLAPRLARVRREVLHGRGFFLLRGLPVQRWTIRQAAIAYWALGSHWGDPVSQNGKGHVLGHVVNLGLDYADPEVRGYQTNARLNYHADSSDIVSLLCLRSGRSGGLSTIVSSTTLWNELVARRPDHAEALTHPLYYTRWGEIPEGREPWAEIAAFTPWGGRMVATYVRSAIMKSQLMPEVPRLTPLQLEAMDHLDALAADPALHLDMAFRPGDVQVLCNHSILHSRTAYEDWPEPERRRHLLRLWLAPHEARSLPAVFAQRYGSVVPGARGGVGLAPAQLQVPLDEL